MDIQQKNFEDDDEAYKPSSDALHARGRAPGRQGAGAAADIVAGAKKPVIIVGRGAQWAGAGPAVLKLAERIGALILTTLLTKTFLNESEYHAGISGVYGSRPAMHLAHEADVVIGVGASLNRHTLENGYMYPEARYVHIDSQAAPDDGRRPGRRLLPAVGRQDRRRGAGEAARQAQRQGAPATARPT